MNEERPNYHSYLLRLWGSSTDENALWHAMLINPHTGERHSFATLAEVVTFLAQILYEKNNDLLITKFQNLIGEKAQMATLADYRVLNDGFIELKQGHAAHTMKVQLPGNFVKGTDLAQPIMAFMVRAVEKAHIRIRVNHKDIFEDDFEPSFRRGFWIPFNGELLTGGTFENEVKFHRDSGTIRFHNIVLWYQLKS